MASATLLQRPAELPFLQFALCLPLCNLPEIEMNRKSRKDARARFVYFNQADAVSRAIM